jgi:RNA polymerase sigma-70 factor (ECF subfamily)
MRTYQDMVYSTAKRLTANESQAEDIAQEVFLKAYAQFDRLRSSQAAGGWLKTVATNLSLNHLSRYRRRWRFFSEFGATDDDGADEPVDVLSQAMATTDDLLDDLDAESRRYKVEECLARLPEHQRVPLVLFHLEDMSYQDIAAILRISLPKLKTDLRRGRLQLIRALLQGD